MQLRSIIKISERLISDNAPTILSSLAVIGTGATAYLSVRAGFRTGEKYIETRSSQSLPGAKLTVPEKVRIYGKEFIPPAAAATATIACVVGAHHINGKRAAALVAAYSLSEGKLKDYKKAVEEKFGLEKKEEVDKKVVEKRAENAPFVERPAPVMIVGDEQLCFDAYSGRYFTASMEDIRRAENDVNYKVIQDRVAPLSYFYELIGMPQTAMSDDWGWDETCPLEIKFSPNFGDNGKVSLMIDYDVDTIRRFNHLER